MQIVYLRATAATAKKMLLRLLSLTAEIFTCGQTQRIRPITSSPMYTQREKKSEQSQEQGKKAGKSSGHTSASDEKHLERGSEDAPGGLKVQRTLGQKRGQAVGTTRQADSCVAGMKRVFPMSDF